MQAVLQCSYLNNCFHVILKTDKHFDKLAMLTEPTSLEDGGGFTLTQARYPSAIPPTSMEGYNCYLGNTTACRGDEYSFR